MLKRKGFAQIWMIAIAAVVLVVIAVPLSRGMIASVYAIVTGEPSFCNDAPYDPNCICVDGQQTKEVIPESIPRYVCNTEGHFQNIFTIQGSKGQRYCIGVADTFRPEGDRISPLPDGYYNTRQDCEVAFQELYPITCTATVTVINLPSGDFTWNEEYLAESKIYCNDDGNTYMCSDNGNWIVIDQATGDVSNNCPETIVNKCETFYGC